MLEQVRHKTILRLLDLHAYTTIHDVVEATGASEATVRRDFITLETVNKLRRVRGGVEQVDQTNEQTYKEPPLDRRMSINKEKKRRIARAAAALIKENQTIIIDGGSTTYHMAEYISSLTIKVVTNSFAIAEHLVKHSNCTVILPEGTINHKSQLILNNLSPDPFQNYHASIGFMGIKGITKNVLTNEDPLLIQSERAMVKHTEKLVILADESKFGTIGGITLFPVEEVSTIITTTDADPELVSQLREKSIEIIQV